MTRYCDIYYSIWFVMGNLSFCCSLGVPQYCHLCHSFLLCLSYVHTSVVHPTLMSQCWQISRWCWVATGYYLLGYSSCARFWHPDICSTVSDWLDMLYICLLEICFIMSLQYYLIFSAWYCHVQLQWLYWNDWLICMPYPDNFRTSPALVPCYTSFTAFYSLSSTSPSASKHSFWQQWDGYWHHLLFLALWGTLMLPWLLSIESLVVVVESCYLDFVFSVGYLCMQTIVAMCSFPGFISPSTFLIW